MGVLAAGVDLFFVISGFVMVHASRDLFGSPDGAMRFLVRRIARIVPLYWLTTTLFLLIGIAMPAALNSEAPTFAQIIASYLFWPMIRADGLVQPVYGLGWTLNYEMFFYALLALCMGFGRSVAVVAVSVALLALAAAGPMLRPQGTPLAFWSDAIVLEFVIGAWIAVAHGAGWRLPARIGVAFIVAGVAMLAADLSGALPRVVAWGVPAALLFVGVVLAEREAAEGWFAGKLAAIGDASYALYLIHPFVIRPVGKLWTAAGFEGLLPAWVFIAVAVALAIGAAMLVYRWIERPMTLAMNARLMPRRA